MPSSGPNFSPYPVARLRQITRQEAALESIVARWIAARPLGAKTAALVGGQVRARIVGVRPVDPRPTIKVVRDATVDLHRRSVPPRELGRPSTSAWLDPHAALADLRVAGASFVVAGASAPVRALAQKLLGGPDELGAPRPLTLAEHAVFSLAVSAAIVDTGIAAEVWPLADVTPADLAGRIAIELVVDGAAWGPTTVLVIPPTDLALRAPPPRPVPAWTFAVPVIVGACALPRESLTGLRPRSVVTIERGLALRVGDRQVMLRAAPGAVEAEVVSGYGAREMTPDDTHLELTVQLGTTQLSLRQLAELAPGQIVQLGRPLAGPFEVRAAGRLIATGELVDVDGELGVRIVSLQE